MQLKRWLPSLYGTDPGSYIGNEGGICYMKYREFISVGKPVPALNGREHGAGRNKRDGNE